MASTPSERTDFKTYLTGVLSRSEHVFKRDSPESFVLKLLLFNLFHADSEWEHMIAHLVQLEPFRVQKQIAFLRTQPTLNAPLDEWWKMLRTIRYQHVLDSGTNQLMHKGVRRQGIHLHHLRKYEDALRDMSCKNMVAATPLLFSLCLSKNPSLGNVALSPLFRDSYAIDLPTVRQQYMPFVADYRTTAARKEHLTEIAQMLSVATVNVQDISQQFSTQHPSREQQLQARIAESRVRKSELRATIVKLQANCHRLSTTADMEKLEESLPAQISSSVTTNAQSVQKKSELIQLHDSLQKMVIHLEGVQKDTAGMEKQVREEAGRLAERYLDLAKKADRKQIYAEQQSALLKQAIPNFNNLSFSAILQVNAQLENKIEGLNKFQKVACN